MNQLFRRKQYNVSDKPSGLVRVLGVWDIVFFGIAAIIGAGSFSSLGEAVFRGGPGVIIYILFAASPVVSPPYVMPNLQVEFQPPALRTPMPMQVLVN